jgi:hypothetical protein
MLPLDEDEVFQPFLPPAHKYEEAISLNDKEFEHLVEVALVFVLPTHKDKHMVIFSHTYCIGKQPLDMVDKNIDTFIQTRRHTWDFGHFIFIETMFTTLRVSLK